MSDFNPDDLAAIQQANVSAEAVEANRRAIEAKAEDAFDDLGKILAATDAQLAAHDAWAVAVISGNSYGHYAEHLPDLGEKR